MRKIAFATTLIAIVLLSWAASQQAAVSADAKGPLYMALIDRHATGASQENRDLAASFVGLMSTFREGQRIGFITAGDEAAIGPSVSGSVEHRSDYREVLARLSNPAPSPVTDLSASLAYAHELMKFQGADEGSTLYVVSGGELEGEAPDESTSLEHLIGEFNAEGWQIVSIALPGSSAYADGFMSAVSDGTGSDRFPLGTPDELKVIADSILSQDARGTLFEIGNDDLAADDVFTATLNIAPSTTTASLVFFKEGPTGSLSLLNPSGVEADSALSSVIETPYMVVWTLADPDPGKWTVEALGSEGFISAWHYPKHTLNIDFVSFDSVPFDQRVDLVAFISDGERRVAASDIEVRATVTDPDGKTSSHALNDNGELGDAVSGDTYYSTTLPPLGAAGEYQVELELYWPQYEHSISTRKALTAQAFPSVDLNLTATDNLTPGERVNIGSAVVNIEGQSYAIPIDRISAGVSSEHGSAVELVPQKLLNAGHASAFDIMFTPVEEERHTLVLRLNMEYASRDYSFTTDSKVLSSVIPPAPPAVAPQPPAPVAPPPAAAPPPPAPAVAAPPVVAPTANDGGGIPAFAIYGLAALAGALVIAGVGYIVYGVTRPNPYGYLHDDGGNLLVNMATLQRSAFTVVMSKNLVRGEELGIAELKGLSFFFGKGQVDIRSGQTEPSIRINNKPLIEGEQTRAGNLSWIGTQGKLFSLQLTAPMASPEPVAAPKPEDGMMGDEPAVAPGVGDD